MVNLGLLPFFHIFGLFVLLMSVIMGARTIIMQRFKPQDFLSTISAYKVNALFVVPSMVHFLAKTPLLDKYDLSSLHDIYCGAAPLNPEIQAIAEERWLKAFATRNQIIICVADWNVQLESCMEWPKYLVL